MPKRTASQSGLTTGDHNPDNNDHNEKRQRQTSVEDLRQVLAAQDITERTTSKKLSLLVKLKIPEHLRYDFELILQTPTASVAAPGADPRNATKSRQHRKIFLAPLTRAALARPGFSMTTALCPHVDVLLRVVSFLPSRTIINLYSISAPFHYQFNSRYETFILHATREWCPNAEKIWPWRFYGKLCIKDPALRVPSTYQAGQNIKDGAAVPPTASSQSSSATTSFASSATASFASTATASFSSTSTISPAATPAPLSSHYGHSEPHRPIKRIPSLRWLSMCVYRHLIIKEIIAYLICASLPIPAQACYVALQKVWFLLDLPLSSLRIALLRNEAYFTKVDIWALHVFFVKLDMYWTDPINCTGGERMVRKYLLMEPSLTTMWDFMRGEDGDKSVDMLRLWVKHGYQPAARGVRPETERDQEAWDNVEKYKVMGVPLKMCGRGGYELYGLGEQMLLRPDELVIREGVRRGYGFETQIFRMMVYGTVDGHLRAPRKWRLEQMLPSLVIAKELADLRSAEERREEQRKIESGEAHGVSLETDESEGEEGEEEDRGNVVGLQMDVD